MSRRIFSTIGLLALIALMVGTLTAAAELPVPTFTLLEGLPSTMNVGETYTVIVRVDSAQPFLAAQALPSFAFPGKGVVAVQGGDRTGNGTSAILEVTFKAKSSTANFPPEVAPVFVVIGVRYAGGYVAVQEYPFSITVP